ncbi:GNAT family N-acetyltransferase [Nocardioides zeae]|uniref:GNAT family N-acetyltransferase n=1 Tax=Nocardioides zeae TaxID=1457234 RepID=A0A6P0HJI6_9ACTN|nr:GNAT family protein [Nocardioides zeae]NEN77805.1 GNAT family N-acetyltransferase [Nocardioides zeae]
MSTALTPHLRTRRVSLRQGGHDVGRTVYRFLTAFGTTALGDPDVFARGITADVSALFTVHVGRDEDPVGFAMLQNLRTGRHVEVGIYTDAERTPLGAGAEATLLVVNYAFAALGVRKVWSVTTEHSSSDFGVAFADERREAVIPDHFWFQGRHWDAHWYSMERDSWSAEGAPFLERLTPRTGSQEVSP